MEKRFIIVTGLSGAGKSLVVKVLEDIGYFCIDNLPASMITQFGKLFFKEKWQNQMAVVVDSRGASYFKGLGDSLDAMDKKGYKYTIIYLEALTSTLISRYKESRREHPLRGGSLSDDISAERILLSNLRERSQHVINTTHLSPDELRETIKKIATGEDDGGNMSILLESFGFKYGNLLEADNIFDVRFMKNPFYLEDLREKTGLDDEVCKYVMDSQVSIDFMDKLKEMMVFLIPQYINEGKSRLVIGIGCTGGKHRSVTVVRLLGKFLISMGYRVTMKHRDL